MNSVLLKDGVVLLDLHPVRSILTVLGSDIARSARHTAILMLGAL